MRWAVQAWSPCELCLQIRLTSCPPSAVPAPRVAEQPQAVSRQPKGLSMRRSRVGRQGVARAWAGFLLQEPCRKMTELVSNLASLGLKTSRREFWVFQTPNQECPFCFVPMRTEDGEGVLVLKELMWRHVESERVL